VTEQAVRTVIHVHCPDRLPEGMYWQVPEQLADLSPVAQVLPLSCRIQAVGFSPFSFVPQGETGGGLQTYELVRLAE
jgi:DNA polymerase-4